MLQVTKEIIVIFFFANSHKFRIFFFLAQHAEEEYEWLNNPNQSGKMSTNSSSIDTTSANATQRTVKESMHFLFNHLRIHSIIIVSLVTNTNNDDKESKIRKAIINIMSSKSVIFTKSDLTHICGNSAIRSDAVDRLLSVGLLQHGKNYWVEPSRTKKNCKKEQKRILKEGWIK